MSWMELHIESMAALRDVLRGRRVGDTAKLVAANLMLYRNNDSRCCFPSMAKMGEDLGLSRQTVQSAINELVKSGAVVKRRRARFNEYFFAACPPPKAFKDIREATDDELKKMTDDMAKRVMDSPFKNSRSQYFGWVQDENYADMEACLSR